MDLFGKLFGFPNTQNPETPNNHRRFGVADFWDGIFHNGQEQQNDPRKSQSFMDPFAMHEFLHEHVNNFFRNFGMPTFGSFDLPEIPSITDGNVMEDYPPDSRESFLKKGALKQSPNYEENVDQDLDGKISKLDVERFFQKPDSENEIVERNNNKPFSGMFFQSVQVEAVTKPDGSMEIRKVVTDSEGNKKVTITERMGDKEYTFNY